MEGFKGKKIPQIHVNEHLLDNICLRKSTPFFSWTSSTTQKHNRNPEPFFCVRETSRFNFRCEVSDIGDQGPWTGTTPRGLRLNESCWPRILYRKNYGDKKGSKSFQQQRRMFCWKFGWPSMKVLQIKVRRLKLFGCSLKLLANVQCSSTRKRSV